MNAQGAFWREWRPVIACALLTGAGLYLLAFTNTPLATFILFVLALGLPTGRRAGRVAAAQAS